MYTLQDEIIEVIRRAHKRPFSFQSDFARQYAEAVAVAASYGWITCLDAYENCPTPRWIVTAEGINTLIRNRKRWISIGNE